MKIYDNAGIKKQLKQQVADGVAELHTMPVLHIIQIGDEFASNTYIHKKKTMGVELGIQVRHHHFGTDASIAAVQNQLDAIIDAHQGVIVQLPVPAQFQPIIEAIPWTVDVDLLGTDAARAWSAGLLSPTIAAIDLILTDMLKNSVDFAWQSRLDLHGITVAVIGQGVLVGNPLLRYLRDREATIISINKDTTHPRQLVQQAQVAITGAGVPGLIDASWLQEKAYVIDAATSESNNKLVGDLDYSNLPEAATVCKSPGGVGPLTVLCLFANVLKLQQLTEKNI